MGCGHSLISLSVLDVFSKKKKFILKLNFCHDSVPLLLEHPFTMTFNFVCHMSRVTCYMSRVIFFGQNGGASQWRVCYQEGLNGNFFVSQSLVNHAVWNARFVIFHPFFFFAFMNARKNISFS